MVAAFSPAHPLAGRKVISLHELKAFPFTLTEPSFGLRQQMDRVFARHGFKPKAFCVTNSLALVKEVAAIGTQCTLLPRFAVERELADGSLRTAPVREFASESLVFCVCSRSDRSLSPAAKVLTDTVIDYCRRYRR
jgi:DNA-binding transcriptional LysR family regulator